MDTNNGAAAMTTETATALITAICRSLAYDGDGKPDAVTYQRIVRSLQLRGKALPPPRRICEIAEAAGWPVWSSAPDEAMRPF